MQECGHYRHFGLAVVDSRTILIAMKRVLFLFALALIGAGCQPPEPVVPQGTQYGISVSPETQGAEAFASFFDLQKQAGPVLSWAGNWKELDKENGAPVVVAELSKQKSFTPVVVFGVKQEDLASETERQALLDALAGFAKAHPVAYLGIGNEINRDFDASSTQEKAFSGFFHDAAAAIKKVAPKTRVFTVFQYEWLVGRRGGLFGGLDDPSKAQWAMLDDFSDADLIAFTSYPSLVYRNPSDIPADYFSAIVQHTGKPVAITETGWFRGALPGWEGSAEKQATYITRLPGLVSTVKPLFVIWPFLFDQSAAQAPFDTMGLLKPGSSTSSAWDAWKDLVRP
jgi:hypothetical protein